MPRKVIKSKFENLPLELLYLIFERLNINELLKCRLLSKKLKKIISDFQIKELNISNERPLNERCYFLKRTLYNKLIFKSLNQAKLIRILNTSIINFNNLNSLKIEFHIFNIEIFNKFKNLKNLDIFISESAQHTDFELCLENLETLNIINYGNDCKINTPKLKSLRIPFIDKINLLNTESILYLETFYFYKKILKLTNLQILKVDKIEYIDSTIIENLNNLKEIYFLSESYIGYSLSPTIETIRHLLNQKTLKKSNLDIYFKDHLVKNLEDLETVARKYRVIEKCGMNRMKEREKATKRNRKHNNHYL